MLIPGSQLINIPILSLQTGSEIARTSRAIVSPDKLYILAFELTGQKLTNELSFLRIDDIREFSDMGMIVDSSDELVELDDIIVLKNIYDSGFDLTDMKVVDEDDTKLGNIESTVINSSTFAVQQINVRRPFLKSFYDTELLIHRSQIKDVKDDKIVVYSAKTNINKSKNINKESGYMNPFRTTKPSRPNTSRISENKE